MTNGENNNGNGEQQGKSGEERKTPFEGEFDAARAARLIENLREEISGLKDENRTLKSAQQEREDAEKSEVERLKDALARAENETKESRQALYIARAQAKHGLSDEEASEFLSGLDDEEKILARAERLAGLRGGGSQEESGEGGEDNGEGGDLSGKPKPRLTPGTGGGEDSGGIDEDAIVNAARERRGY